MTRLTFFFHRLTMSTVPTAPELSLETLFEDLDPDQIIADEQDNPPTPLPSTLGKRPSPPGQTGDNNGSDDDSEENVSPGPEGRGPQGYSSSGTQINVGSLRIEQLIRKMTKELRLSRESVDLVQRFAQVSIFSST